MENFLSKDNSTRYQKEKTAGPSRSALCATQKPNLIFNPQPKTNGMIPSKLSGETDRGHSAVSYWKLRTAKLSSQAPSAVSQIFAGLSFYFNGRTGDKQTMHLKGAVSKYGGRTTPFLSVKGVTHVIAENLSAVKTDKAMKSLKMKVVHPDWILRCMAEERLLPDAPFRVVRSQKLGVDHFFSAGKSTAVKRNPSDAAPMCGLSTIPGSARTATKLPSIAPGHAQTSSKVRSTTPGRVVESVDDTRRSATGSQDGCTPPLTSKRTLPTERARTCTVKNPRNSGQGKVGSSTQGSMNQRSGSRKRREGGDSNGLDKGGGAERANSREDLYKCHVPESVPGSSRRVLKSPSEVGARATSPLHQSRRTKRKWEYVSSLAQCLQPGEDQTTGEPAAGTTGDDLPTRRACMDNALPAMVDLTRS